MPDLEISRLEELLAADVQGTDPLPIADLSAVETKKVTVASLVSAGINLVGVDTIDPDQIDWDSQSDGEIKGGALQDRSVDASKLVADSLTADEIAPNAIGASELADGAVDTLALADGAVTADKVADNSLSDGQIAIEGIGTTSLADGAVTRAKLALDENDIDGSIIADESITADKLADNSLDSTKLAADSVSTDAIQSKAVTTAKIADNAVGDAQIATTGLSTTSFADGSITVAKLGLNDGELSGSLITSDSVTAGEIAPNAIGTSELADGAVDTNSVADNAITAAKISANSLSDAQMAPGGIGTTSLADGAVTRAKLTLVENDIDGSIISDDSITAAEIAPDAIGASELADGAVDTDSIADGAVTTEKIADNSIVTSKIQDSQITGDCIASAAITAPKLANDSVSTNKIVNGNVTAAKLASNLPGSILSAGAITTIYIADNAVTEAKISDGACTTDKLADNAVTDVKIAGISGTKLSDGTVTAEKLSPSAFTGGIQLDGTVQHINEVTPGSSAGISWDSHGHVTSFGPIPSTDLPVATATSVGGISVPADSGLTVSAIGEIDHVALLVPGEISGFTYDEHGHITETRPLQSVDLPSATNTDKGAVSIPTTNNNPLSLLEDGELVHAESSIAPGTYASVTVDTYGHIATGDAVLAVNQVPNLPASIITSGQFPTERLEDDVITSEKVGDYATCLMQEAFPGEGDFLGQFWYTPSTAQLRVYARGSGPQNVWIPVGFGNLQQENLRFGFTYDATTSTIINLTAQGLQAGLVAGAAIPQPTDELSGLYGVCIEAGNSITVPELTGKVHTPGDWIVCITAAEGWIHVDVTSGGGGGGGATVLNDLLDVNISSLENSQVLQYDGGLTQWINVDMPVTIDELNDLSDVNANPTAAGDFLTWNGTDAWVATNTIDCGTY